MKGAACHPVRALLLELDVVLHHPDDVCLSFEVVDESLGVTHYLKICIRVRSTTAVRRRYFLKSALLTNASTIFETASAPCLVGRIPLRHHGALVDKSSGSKNPCPT